MRHILLVYALFLSSTVLAQQATHEDSVSFNRLVKKLRPLSQKLAVFQWFSEDTADDPEKRFDKLEHAFYPSLEKLLANPLSFNFSFKGFGNVLVDKSPDGKLHVINAGYATGGTS
ncbi:MAG TPA: hypothetical protein VFO76_10915, partial [Candidatus Kapabacteria bacterium]|nr:hypothetical protein [Candidatus Kapabacteria bacterium]